MNDDDDDATVSIGRVQTRPLDPVLPYTIAIDLADADQAAGFLEVVAKVLRSKGRIKFTVE